MARENRALCCIGAALFGFENVWRACQSDNIRDIAKKVWTLFFVIALVFFDA